MIPSFLIWSRVNGALRRQPYALRIKIDWKEAIVFPLCSNWLTGFGNGVHMVQLSAIESWMNTVYLYF